MDGKDFRGVALQLLKSAQEVPVSTLGNHFILGEDSHSVDRRRGLFVRGLLTSDNDIFAILHVVLLYGPPLWGGLTIGADISQDEWWLAKLKEEDEAKGTRLNFSGRG